MYAEGMETRKRTTVKLPLALGVALLVVTPLISAAQAPSTSSDLQIERKERKPVVLPKPSQDQMRVDAERAVDEILGREPGTVVRDTSPVRPSSRPDMNYDVKSGIQSDRVNKELFKR